MGHQLKPAFRHRESGKVVATNSFHDVDHPDVAGWHEPEEGYVDPEGKFYTRDEAHAKFVAKSETVISSDVKDIKDIHNSVELLATQLEEMMKAEKAQKSLIVPHNHSPSAVAGSGVDDVPPGKTNPVGTNDPAKNTKMVKGSGLPKKSKRKPESLVNSPGIDKAEIMSDKNCKKCGELWKADAEKCAKCGDMAPGKKVAKAEIVYDPTGKLSLKGVNSKAVLPGDKATTSEISAEGSGGQIKKYSLASIRKAAGLAKAEPPMAKPPSGKTPGALPASKPAAPKPPEMGKIALPDAVPGEPAKLKKPLRAGVMSAKDAKEAVTKGDFGMTDSGKASTLPAAQAPAAPPKPQYTAENLKADKAKMLNANVKPNRPGIFAKLQKKSK